MSYVYLPETTFIMSNLYSIAPMQTLKDVCNKLHVSRGTILNWVKKGKFPKAYQNVPRGKLLWDIDVINEWIKDNK